MELFRLTPRILDQLHQQLEENLNLSIFNPQELQMKDFDFSGNPCQYIKLVTLDFGNLFQHIDNLELEEAENREVETDNIKLRFQHPSFSSLPMNQFRAQIKIIKEVYGIGALSEPLNVYYVVFAESPCLD